jgi:hypothetical protein
MAAWLDLDGGFRAAAAGPGAVSRKRVSGPVQRLDLGSAAREVAAHLGLRRLLLRASEAGSRRQRPGHAFQRSGGILVAAVRSSRLPISRGRGGLLAIFRVRSAAHAGLAQHEELVPVFAEGRCPRCSRRRDVRARASEALATLVPVMAAAIARRDLEGAHGRYGFDRDRRLAARASARRAVQRGLFERRSEREADEAEAEAARSLGVVIAEPPQPVLLLFLTS